MSNHQSLLINPADLQEVQQALPLLPTCNSYNLGSEGILILHYEQHPAHEVPEYATKYHVVPIWGLDSHARIEARLDDRLYCGMFGQGASGIIPAHFEHWAVWNRKIDLTVIFLHPKFVEQVAQGMTSGSVELIPKHDACDSTLTQLGFLLKADLEAGHPSGKLYRDSIATALAARLISHHSTCPIQPMSATSSGLSSIRLQHIVDYIQEYLEQNIKLTDLAHLIGLSESYLCRAFKKTTGISIHQYLLQQRIERAKGLLNQQHLTIAEIAQRCGFSSHSHLSQQFKRLVGVSPTQLRSLQQGQDFDRQTAQEFDSHSP